MPNRPQRLLLESLSAVYVASLLPAARRFARAARAPERAQDERLRTLLAQNAGSAYGRAHGFGAITSFAQFQARVPIVDYDALEAWIGRAAAGEPAVLTSAPPRIFERSGGSTSTNKLIPYTPALLAELSAATSPWLFDLHRADPALVGTRSYWSLSPATRGREKTAGGTPIGFEDDTEYFTPAVRWALRKMMAVPPETARLGDMTSWREATVRALLAAGDLGLISVWSPTFLLLLMRAIEERLPGYLDLRACARRRDSRAGARGLGFLTERRRAEIEEGLAREGRVCGEALWPRLRVVSAWTDGISREFLPALRAFFPRTAIQAKGLFATEGVVSFPLRGEPGAVLAVASHVLEFLDVERGDAAMRAHPLRAHELSVGGLYSPLLTTGGGFYRYHLKDVVRCVGHHRKTPLVRFEGKLDCVSDVVGEKIHARQIDDGLARVRAALGFAPTFALCTPEHDGPVPRYTLYLEADAESDETLVHAGEIVESYLSTGHHYRYARALGQLGPLRVVRVHDGAATYARALVAAGQRLGDIKPTHLDTRTLWSAAFAATKSPR